MEIAENTITTLNYVMLDQKQTIVDDTYANSPLKFTYGKGQLPPGLEIRLKGLRPGDKKRIIIPAEHGYGLRNKELIIKVHKSELPDQKYKIGSKFRRLNVENIKLGGESFVVKGYVGDWIYLDKNHPLAGFDLSYDVIILAVDSIKLPNSKTVKEQLCLKIV